MNDSTRLPPQNLDAEASVLRAILLDNSVVDDALAEMTADDLYSSAHRIVFGAMLDLIRAGTPATALTVAERLEHAGTLTDVGGWERLLTLLDALPSETHHVRYHARLIRETAQRRHLIYAAREIANAALDHADIDDLTARLTRAQHDITGTITMPPPFALDLITSDQFAATNYRQHFSIRRVLVEGQPCVLGGPKKVLKTSLLVDLALSLGTGTPFLSHDDFTVADPVNVLMLSGESGGYTLQETARRIALARGRMLSTARIYWGFALPQLGNVMHLAELAKQIREHDIKVAIIDPAYLCLLSAGMNTNITSNVFGMGALLKGISEIARDTGCTPIIAHHTRKGDRANLFGVPDLEDLSGSGFAEWARQWVLLNRREPYEAGSGEHRLWLHVGGSAGHSGTWALDIDEGVIDEHGSGRTWNVSVLRATEAVQQTRAAKEAEAEERDRAKRDQQREAILRAYRLYPDGETGRAIREAAGISGRQFTPINADLLADGIAESCTIKKNHREEAAFRLVRRDGGTDGCPAGTVPPRACGGTTPPYRGESHPTARAQPPRNGKPCPTVFGDRDR